MMKVPTVKTQECSLWQLHSLPLLRHSKQESWSWRWSEPRTTYQCNRAVTVPRCEMPIHLFVLQCEGGMGISQRPNKRRVQLKCFTDCVTVNIVDPVVYNSQNWPLTTFQN